MLVDDMRMRMSAAEYLSWSIYYARIAQREELARR
jgi:hypothetical protein